jgi:hypothetical protein
MRRISNFIGSLALHFIFAAVLLVALYVLMFNRVRSQEPATDDYATSPWIYNGAVGLSFVDPRPSLWISTGPSPEAYVAINPDGDVKYGKDYTPDAAAKAFWDAVGVERKARNCP